MGQEREKGIITVAIQGHRGSFHHIAAEGFFGPGQGVEIVPCATFRQVVRTLEEGGAQAAVMAIENSIAGSILPNYALLQSERVRVVGELYLRIAQHLLVLPDVELEDIREVWSHPMALLQCADYLDSRGWRLVETEDTALSARQIAEGGIRYAAAIAGELSAGLFGLKVIAPEINTIKNNLTRFMVLQHAMVEQPEAPQEINKASLYFRVGHRKGALVQVLSVLERYNINMTKLQSCPVPSDPFHYLFHADVEFGDVWEYREAIRHMSGHSTGLRVYGEYTKGKQL